MKPGGYGRVLLFAPVPPPYGGMALQAGQLHRNLLEDGVEADLFAANFPLPGWLRQAERVPGLRTALRFLLIWPKLWRAAGPCEVVHILAASWEYFFLAVYPAVLVGRLRRKRLVVNYRGGDARRFFRWFGWAATPVLRMADRITAPSRFVAEALTSRFGVAVDLVPNLVNTRRFRFRRREALRPKLLVTRHLEKIYDVATAIRAFRAIERAHPDAALWIAGAGTEEAALRALAADLEGVRFLGRVDHAELPAIYDQCDILLNTSTVDNFPGSLLEASAAGLAIVSTDAGGIPFLYEHGRSALLVRPGDAEAAAAAVEDLLRLPGLAAALTGEAAEIARSCEWEQVRRRLYRSYGWEQRAAGQPDGTNATILRLP